MKAYVVIYDGSWMGGRAFVLADSVEEAMELARNDKGTNGFQNVQVHEHDPNDASKKGVVYNWDGEY
jgi:hypothetical protein